MKMFTWNIVNAVTFCFGNASLYVGAMYLIPKRVRSQPRDSIVHVSNMLLLQLNLVSVSIANVLILCYITTDAIQNGRY